MRRSLHMLAGLCLAATVLLLPGSANAATGQSTWSTGSMAPGTSRTWHWNNASASLAYQVGLSPQGATAAATCEFEVTRDWYVQRVNTGGATELEYWFTVSNIGSLTCSADVLLSWMTTTVTLGTMSAAPGPGGTWYYYAPSTATTAVLPALTPHGATSAATCEFEVGLVQIATFDGERRHGITIKNVGSITCQVDVKLVPITAGSSWSTGTMAPYTTKTWRWNNANPLTATYVVGITPQEEGKWWGVERTWYVQRVNTDGTAEREFFLAIRHYNSATSGTAQVLLSRVV